MLQTEINPQSLTDIFKQFQQAIGGVVSQEGEMLSLFVNNQIGQGTIKGISLKGGISYLDFDMEFYDDITVNALSPNTSPIYFVYCSQGWLSHGFGNNYKEKKLDCYQTGIIANCGGVNNILSFKKNVPLKTVTIVVNTTGPKSGENKDLNAKLNSVFLQINKDPYFYTGSYNLKIADVIRNMDSIEDKGVIRTLLIESHVNMILGLELQQHKLDLALKNNNTGLLTTREMQYIEELSVYINENLDKRLSIKFLCTKVGISPRKLQEGFKMMHNTTVTDYIREVRLLKAEDLLKSTELNVSEVVYSIGITSRSYFSKIFKGKFKISPKDYKAQNKSIAVTA